MLRTAITAVVLSFLAGLVTSATWHTAMIIAAWVAIAARLASAL